MNELFIHKGIMRVGDAQFHNIEGGFGSGKKAILAKDIAAIHSMDLKVINQDINRNRSRFKDGIHIMDLKKSVTQVDRDFLNKLGFSNSSIANANNIYILSERGYAVLLKILENEVAWEQYEKLVDGYFSLRAESKRVRTKPIDTVFRQQLNMAKAFSQVSGVSLGIAIASAINKAEKLTGEDFSDWKRLIPARTDDEKIPHLNATKLGGLIGLPPHVINKRLEESGLQVKVEKCWQLTEEGKKHGSEFPYERNGHCGYQILWRESAVDAVMSTPAE